MNLYGPKHLAESIRAVRRNTVLIAEDIHEDDYLYRPTVGCRSVAEILIHIAFFSNFDHLFHEDEHVTTLEAFDLASSSEIARHKRRGSLRNPNSLSC